MQAQPKIQSILDQLNTVIVGKKARVQDCVACLLAGGHLLIEDVPGVGKTTLAKRLAALVTVPFKRVQATPDLTTTDLIGSSPFDSKTDSLRFIPEPVFTSFLLLD